ncbi:MAG: metal-dependent hydrolase [Nanoarchaeota archaeon]|nr:metal-dependent hydrolase [Nanoarchaeota archaeon]
MLGRTHLVFGLFLSTFFTSPLAWLFVLFGSLVPDIDSSTSILGRKARIIGKTFEHRGFFHSLFFLIPSSLIIYGFSPLLSLSFTIGVGGHLLLDMLTKQGIRIYPFKKKISGTVRVGSFQESIFFLLFLFLFLFRLWL